MLFIILSAIFSLSLFAFIFTVREFINNKYHADEFFPLLFLLILSSGTLTGVIIIFFVFKQQILTGV